MAPSGWITLNSQWFTNMFLPDTETIREGANIVLFLDGHGSHNSVRTVLQGRVEMLNFIACHHMSTLICTSKLADYQWSPSRVSVVSLRYL